MDIFGYKPSRFKDNHSYEKRFEESRRVLEKYPDRIPVIVERAKKTDPGIDRKKYLVPNTLSVAEFLFIIRKRMKLPSEKSIYLFVNDTTMPPTSALLSSLYYDNKDTDNFLYITYTSESTFG